MEFFEKFSLIPSLTNDQIRNIVLGILLLFVGWWIINKLGKITVLFFQKAYTDQGIISFLDSLLRFSLRVILILLVLSCFGMNLSGVIAAIGVSLVTLAISIKDSFSGIVAGIILVLNKPIHVGDYIEFENIKGTVIKIEMIFTTLQTEGGEKTVIIPNSRLIAGNIIRESAHDAVNLKLSYESEFTEKHPELKKHLEKELLLNGKILTVPPCKTKIILNGEKNKILLEISLWCQNRYLEDVKSEFQKTMNKMSKKFSIKFEEPSASVDKN